MVAPREVGMEVQGGGEDGSSNPQQQFTVDDVLNELGFGVHQALLLMLCGAGWAADIMDIQALSFLLPKLHREWKEPVEDLGLAASSTFGGMLVGSLFWGIISDRIGRRPAFMMTTLIASCCGMLAATSRHLYELVAWRGAQGFGLGGNLAVDFSLFMEFVPVKSRGPTTVLMTIFATWGSLAASNLAGRLLESAGWRVFLVSCSAPGMVVALGRVWMMESPHFLANAGRLEACLRVLKRVSRQNRVAISIQHASQIQAGRKGGKGIVAALWSLAARRKLRWKLLGTCTHWFFLCFAFYGFNVWAPSYFHARGMEPQIVYLLLSASVVCQFPGTFIAAYLVNKVGRRSQMVVYAVGCGAAVLGVAVSASQNAMVGFTLGLNFFTAALWAVTYTYTPEIFPTHARTTAMGMCASMARVAGILTSYVGGLLLSRSSELLLGAYAVSYAVCALTLLFAGTDMTGVPLSALDVEDPSTGDEHATLAKSDQLSGSEVHDSR